MQGATPFRTNSPLGTSVAVVCIHEGRVKIELSFHGRTVCFDRESDEPLSKTVGRISLSCQKAVGRPVKRPKRAEKLSSGGACAAEPSAALPPAIHVVLLRTSRDSGPLAGAAGDDDAVPLDVPVGRAFVEASSLCVDGVQYRIVRDPPRILRLELPTLVMVGCPVIPYLRAAGAPASEFEFEWRVFSPSKAAGNHSDRDDAEGCSSPWRGEWFRPALDQAGQMLLLKAFHPSDEQATAATLSHAISQAPDSGGGTFSGRRMQEWRANRPASLGDHPRPGGAFRACTFNILAPMYSRSEKTARALFPYCASEHLEFEYRRHLLLREILEIDADLLCLQECSFFFFKHSLSRVLDRDFLLSYRQKAGSGGESDGCALAIRKACFELIARRDIESFTEAMKTHPRIAPLLQKLREAMPQLEEEVLPHLKTLAQIAVLRTRAHVAGQHRILVVANTHLFFHPGAPHVRLLQVATLLVHCEAVLQEYGSADAPAAVLVCGDLNSGPGSGVWDLLVKGALSKDHDDWLKGLRFFWGRGRPGAEACGAEGDGDEGGGADAAMQPCETLSSNGGCAEPQQNVPPPPQCCGVDLAHSLHLSPAWGAGDVEFTNVVQGFNGVLDHVFLDTNALAVQSRMPGSSLSEVTSRYGGLPNEVYGSDHLAMACDLEWRSVCQPTEEKRDAHR